MPTAAIVIGQRGKPQGLPGRNRDDLSLGSKVVLTNNNNAGVESWSWELFPPVGSKAVLYGAKNPTATFDPDITGSYEVKLTVGGTEGSFSDTRVAAIGTGFLKLRKPVMRGPDALDDKWIAIADAFDKLDADALKNMKVDGSNAPKSDVSWGGHRIVDLSGLELDGPVCFGKTNDPEALPDKGFLYLREVEEGADLFYCPPKGSPVRLTRNGRLNIPVIGDEGQAYCDDKDLFSRLSEMVMVSSGLTKSVSEGSLTISAAFGSEPGTVCAGDDPRLEKRAFVKHANDHMCGDDRIGTKEPSPDTIPRSNSDSRLDDWISAATRNSRGTIKLCHDVDGNANRPMVVGLRGCRLPDKVSGCFLKWNDEGTCLESIPYGNSTGTVCSGDDKRLSDARSPIGKARGQLSGEFPEPNVIGITESGGEKLKMGPVPDGCALVRRDDSIVGLDISSRQTIALVLNEKIGSITPELVGCYIFDGSQSGLVSFMVVGKVNRLGLTGIVELRNATDSCSVAEIKFGETSFANKRKCEIHLPPGKKVYEIYINLANGKGRDDRMVCMWAGMIIGA